MALQIVMAAEFFAGRRAAFGQLPAFQTAFSLAVHPLFMVAELATAYLSVAKRIHNLIEGVKF